MQEAKNQTGIRLLFSPGLYGAEEQWHALWITIDSNRLAPGVYPIEITIENGIGDGKKSQTSAGSSEIWKYTFLQSPFSVRNRSSPVRNCRRKSRYYCCGQYKKVANRFFSMPSARNRILGVQLYKYNIKGFLQWGYNFWYSQFSLSEIDPYLTTDSGGAFPSGDPFTKYFSPPTMIFGAWPAPHCVKRCDISK